MKPRVWRWLSLVILVLVLSMFAGCGDSGDHVEQPQADAGRGDASPDDASTGEPCSQPGIQGCACLDDGTCGTNAYGEALTCIGGICESESCVSGDTGCVCRSGTDCSDPGAECSDGWCRPADCQPGQLDCACAAGSCAPGLFCKGGVTCADATGFEGGPCLANGTCERGNRCESSLDICVHCELGSAGCHCRDTGRCNDGLACAAGFCVDANEIPPSDPACYTPCRGDLIGDDGSERLCDSDGLMQGCLDGQTCAEGSCVPEGDDKPTCASDLDCPVHQACMQGGCYSNCQINADCPAGLGCYMKVCRTPCDAGTGASACPNQYQCDAPDGENGYCVPLGEPAPPEPQPQQAAGFSVSHTSITFSNIDVDEKFQIFNEAVASRDFEVRKLSHTIYFEDGSTEMARAPRDPQTGEFTACDAARGECPLWWLEIGEAGNTSLAPATTMRVAGGCDEDSCPKFELGAAGDGPGVRWEGELLISGKDGQARVRMTYIERPEGQWTGQMYYFGAFHDTELDAWLAKTDRSDVDRVENALIKRWGALRGGRLNDGWGEFEAILTATRTGSWQFATVDDKCVTTFGRETAACYPYEHAGPLGIRLLAQDTNEAPVPMGVTEFPIAFNLQSDGSTGLTGKMVSSRALHYPENPGITLTFEADPTDPNACSASGQGDCLVFLKDLDAVIHVGGRYHPRTETCETGYTLRQEPWLVDGFVGGTAADPQGGGRLRLECRDALLPHDTTTSPALATRNELLAGANPVPDGLARERRLELLDGALVNQSKLFILFRETFESFIPGEFDEAYGYMVLERSPANLKDEDFQAAPAAGAPSRVVPDVTGAYCSDAIVKKMLGSSAPSYNSLDPSQLNSLADRLINGSPAQPSATRLYSGVHYLCHENGLFDGGAGDNGTWNSTRVSCPNNSEVTFFYVGNNLSQYDIASQPCQQDGSCKGTLDRWLASGQHIIEYQPLWQCSSSTEVFCDADRANLRNGKTFYRAVAGGQESFPLASTMANAFRYKILFRSEQGASLGFVPEQCLPNSSQRPYCYDPRAIEETRGRVDCLIQLYSDDIDELAPTHADAVRAFLKESFSEFGSHEGFERLYAELLIMLGDESLTGAFSSRFDLAATNTAAFLGSKFEPNGVDLSGLAGSELFLLYQATQYYQMALDRLYKLGPDVAVALSRGATTSDVNFVSPETVTLYIERLTRAATQKARAWGQVSRRYQNLHRPDLARAVIERAYTSTYLESALMTRLMQDIARQSEKSFQAQIREVITTSQRRMRAALRDMRDVSDAITESIDYFGFPPDYIPFPAMDTSDRVDTNAFEVLVGIARNKVELAKQRELNALQSNASKRTDTATFQAELVRVRNTYEDRLTEICGTFQGRDGRIYPAISKYAHLNDTTTLLGDPCGRMGNGGLFQAKGEVEQTRLGVESVVVRFENVLREIEIERDRVSKQCGLINEVAQYQYNRAGEVVDLQKEAADKRILASFIQRELDTVSQAMSLMDCESFGCAASAGLAASYAAIGTTVNLVQADLEKKIAAKERQISQIEMETARWVTESECSAAKIDSNARTATLALGLEETELEMLRARYQLRLAVADIQRLVNEARRWEAQQAEAEQLLINVEAARNDPNVRIYRNDAVINADFAFEDALRTVYRATRVYEYYTSQSYADREDLFLVRMVTAGQKNLENYLIELENAFYEFEEDYGVPDTRVAVLSLRDDVMQIPLLDENGQAHSLGARIDMMRERLGDVALLDSNGYLTIPFGTTLETLSPLTRNHKVRWIEADIVGSSTGDTVGRVYLRQGGTGLIHNIAGERDYYVFPERTAVINPFFNGNRVFDADVYRNFRMRDRPYVNTLWELVINQRDEAANRDIDLSSLSDIRLLIYYTDFTAY